MSTSGAQAGGAQQRTTRLQAAQIMTLFSAPTVLVPAAGANRAIIPVAVVGEYVPGTGSFTGATSPLRYKADGSGLSVVSLSFDGLNGVLPTHQYLDPQVLAINGLAADVANQPIVVGGDGVDGSNIGAIVTATLNAAGAAYAVNDTGTVDTDQYTGGATYKVLTVGGAGAVATFQITAGGAGYSTVDNPLSTTPGGGQAGIGTGFKVNVTAVTPATGDLYITVVYNVVTTH